MAKGDRAGPPPALVEGAAGLGAGTAATLAVHPLDVVKTRMQGYRGSRTAAAARRPPPTTAALLAALGAADRPLASLYRGLAPNLFGNAAGWASFFFLKARAGEALALARARRHNRALDDDDDRRRRRRRSPPPTSPADHFVASAAAGAATAALTNPVWVLKTRIMSSDAGAAGAYPSMAAGARAIYAAEGLRGFYRGLAVSLLGVSHGAVQFAVYEPAKRLYSARRRHDADAADAPMTAQATVALSSAAKLVAGAVTYPYQVLRTRLQNHGADERFGRGFGAVVARTWRDEGVAGFYRGLVPSVLRVMPATWVTFVVYEKLKYHLPRVLA